MINLNQGNSPARSGQCQPERRMSATAGDDRQAACRPKNRRASRAAAAPTGDEQLANAALFTLHNRLSRQAKTTMKILSTLILSITLLLSACSQPVAFKSSDITGVDWGKTLSLTDHNGKPRQLADFKGQAIVLFFGYTQCPDVCPTTLLAMRDVLKRLGDSASRVQVLFVTLDPERDTAQLLSGYVTAFDPSFIGLRGDDAATAVAAKEFKVFSVKQAGSTPDTYSIDHSTGSYVFDPQGKLRLLVRHGEPADSVAADIKRLLDGQ
jgi:protein SCO1/2